MPGKTSGARSALVVSALNLAVVKIDSERNLILVKGAVPGHAGGEVIVRPTVK